MADSPSLRESRSRSPPPPPATGTLWTGAGGLAGFLFATVRSSARLPTKALPWSLKVTSDQVRFTFLQGLPLVAFPLGLAVTLEALRFRSLFGAQETLGVVVVLIVIRHFGPLLTAMLVVGRSGTVIAAEMATVRFTGEVDAMRGIGVDPLHYYVHPRLVAGAISVPALIIVFDFVAVGGAWLAASAREAMTWGAFVNTLLAALEPLEVPVTLVKGALFGTGMVVFCVHAGLVHGTSPTAVPVATSKGVIRSLLFVFALFPRLATG